MAWVQPDLGQPVAVAVRDPDDQPVRTAVAPEPGEGCRRVGSAGSRARPPDRLLHEHFEPGLPCDNRPADDLGPADLDLPIGADPYRSAVSPFGGSDALGGGTPVGDGAGFSDGLVPAVLQPGEEAGFDLDGDMGVRLLDLALQGMAQALGLGDLGTPSAIIQVL
jgi:hypothetical protein